VAVLSTPARSRVAASELQDGVPTDTIAEMMRLAISLVAALVLSSCGDDSEMAMDFPPTSTINGEVPPGRMYPLVDVTTMLDTITADGDRLVITRGVRLAGTRVGIHVHEYGGQTCVISGTITDFVEGQEPAVFPEGTCYYMPPNTPMSAANLEDVPAILIDTFKVPPGAPTITVIEPGWQEVVEEAGLQ
jgi:quercetin dioxygenase-like cupin family protein